MYPQIFIRLVSLPTPLLIFVGMDSIEEGRRTMGLSTMTRRIPTSGIGSSAIYKRGPKYHDIAAPPIAPPMCPQLSLLLFRS